MTVSILATVAAYILIAVLLLSMNLTSTWKWWVKAGAIGVTVVFFAGSYAAIVSLLGWPTTDRVPDRFQLLWSRIVEPDKRTGEDGTIYLWVEQLDESNLASGRPRAFELPYTDELAKQLRDAQEKREEGQEVAGTARNGDPLGEVEQAEMTEFRQGNPFSEDDLQIRFQDLPPIVLPDKPPL